MTRWLTLTASLAIIFALSGCGTLGNTASVALDAQKALITACNSFAAAENTIAGYIRAGQIKVASFAAIDQIKVVPKAICDPTKPLPANALDAVNAVTAAVTALLTFKPAGA